MVGQLLEALLDLLLYLFLLVLERLDHTRNDIAHVLALEDAKLWQLLNDVQVERTEHRAQRRQRFLPLFEQFLLQLVDVEQIVLIDFREVCLFA